MLKAQNVRKCNLYSSRGNVGIAGVEIVTVLGNQPQISPGEQNQIYKVVLKRKLEE